MKPLITEKAIMRIELENTLTFRVEKVNTKEDIKKDVEELFKVKVGRIRTLIKNNRKVAYVQLKKEFPAIDVATKLGMI